MSTEEPEGDYLSLNTLLWFPFYLEYLKTKVNELLERFKGDRYIHGSGCGGSPGSIRGSDSSRATLQASADGR